jgi:hypothetical protein
VRLIAPVDQRADQRPPCIVRLLSCSLGTLSFVTSAEQFIASLVHSLVWPGAVVVLALVFRRQFSKLLLSLSRLRAGPVDLMFAQQLAKVEEEVAEELPAAKQQPGLLTSDLRETAEVAPATAVLEASVRLESELANLIRDVGNGWVFGSGLVALARQALDHNLITPETANAVKGIAVLRNLAAHDRMSRLSSAQAQEYLSLADATIFALKQRPGVSST